MKAAAVILAAWAVLEFSAPPICRAHDPGLSSTIVSIEGTRMEAVMSFNDADLPIGEKLAADDLLRVLIGGRDVPAVSLERVAVDERHSELRLSFVFGDAGGLSVAVPLLSELPFGHKHYLEIRRGGAVTGAHILSAGAAAVAVGAAPPARAQHGLAGYDRMMLVAVLAVGVAAWAAYRPQAIRAT